ncbi:MAG TPA: hypothetical protein VGS41_07240, partial [Chthonomonadales bacterium]|nr:hypothetical protein [Chthonomonadales bacterium]
VPAGWAPIRQLAHPTPAAAAAPLLPTVIAVGDDNTIRRFSPAAGAAVTLDTAGAAISAAAPIARENGLATVGPSGMLQIWWMAGERPALNVANGLGDCMCVAATPDGKLLAVGGSDERIKLFYGAQHKEIGEAQSYGDVRALSFTSDGSRLVSGSSNRMLRIWKIDPARGTPIIYQSTIVAHDDAVLALAVSPDSSLIASVSADGFLKIWRLDGGGLVDRIRAGAAAVTAVAFSPDGSTVAAGDEAGNIRLWNVADGAPLMFHGSEDRRKVTALAWSADGLTLVSGGEDDCVRYWNPQSGAQIASQDMNQGAVRALVVTAGR